ncbi:hypothetical protein MLD38_025874 [Melastoma candidum]|uniref:Uncharacterized protein n=1 Tax=Melastoma candidum TaxID=119954 RepID=A0ACB9NWU2_9MYRT|nr:hypothetical protein MLD38_025874 [Melastoma candidum]
MNLMCFLPACNSHVAFSQLIINGVNQGVHAFIVLIRDADGNICPNIWIADCGHKKLVSMGLTMVEFGMLLLCSLQVMFDNVRIPLENLLNSVADVNPDGQYVSAIKDQDQRFAAFLAPLTSGRVNIAIGALYSAKIGLAIAIRYTLARRAFSTAPNECEVLPIDYPSHQRRLLPLLAKTYAMTFTGIHLKQATFTWHNMRTLQECREACGGQGLKTENRVGHLNGEFDMQSTFEGDNNVPMQQVPLLTCCSSSGLKHMNKSCLTIPSHMASYVLRIAQFQVCTNAASQCLHALSLELLLVFRCQSYSLAEDLVSVEEDAAFLRYGYLSTDNAASVRQEVSKLCSELRPHALVLVNSLGIPDAFLGLIAFDWVATNSWSSVQQ